MQKDRANSLKRIYEAELPSRAVLVWLYLYQHSNKDGFCFPAIKTIARETNISVSTVKRALADLVSAGFIEKKSRYRDNNAQSSNLYLL